MQTNQLQPMPLKKIIPKPLDVFDSRILMANFATPPSLRPQRSVRMAKPKPPTRFPIQATTMTAADWTILARPSIQADGVVKVAPVYKMEPERRMKSKFTGKSMAYM